MILYHGSSVLFDRFDLAHVLEGDGKVKFGYGVYLTSSFRSAAHYSGAGRNDGMGNGNSIGRGTGDGTAPHYVYTVEVPGLTEGNHIDFKKPVHPDIVRRAEQKLEDLIPHKVTLDGKDFRKYLAKYFRNQIDLDVSAEQYRTEILNLMGEQEASEFLKSIGVEFICWPYSWKNPEFGLNVAVLDDQKIKILKVHQVELDNEQQLIPGSEKEVRL